MYEYNTSIYSVLYTGIYIVLYTGVFCITVALGFGKWILNASKALEQMHSTLGSVFLIK